MGLYCALSTLSFAASSFLQIGSEIPILPSLAGDQVRPAIAIDAAGGMMVWQDNASDGFGLGLGAMRLGPDLVSQGQRFRVNASPEGDQENPRISLLDQGRAVIVWQGGPNGSQNVYARFLNADGSFATAEDLLISEPSVFSKSIVKTNWQMIRNNKLRLKRQRFRCVIENRHEFAINPVVSSLSDGSVVVAYGSHRQLKTSSFTLATQVTWKSKKQMYVTNTLRQPFVQVLATMQDVYFQRLSADGQKLGPEQVANGTRDFNQRNPSLAALSDGRFVLCWISEGTVETGPFAVRVDTSQRRVGGGRADVYARIFEANGTPVGPEWRVSTTDLTCAGPSVAAWGSDGFTIAWAQRGSSRENGWDIYFRSYDSSGMAEGPATQGNSHAVGDQFGVSVTSAGEDQLLVWSSMGQDGSWEGVYGRWLRKADADSDEFRINTTTRLGQIHPAASARDSQAIVIWSGYAFEGGFDLFMQPYRKP